MDPPLLCVASPDVWLRVEADPAAAGRSAAVLLADRAKAALAAGDVFVVAVSGGSIPPLLSALVQEPLLSSTDFSRWRFIFADERCVPLDHADSNFRLWKTEIFDKIPGFSVERCVLPIEDWEDAQRCADNYTQRLGAFLNRSGPLCVTDTIADVAVLGMGPDGHTASLFPSHPLVTAAEAGVTGAVVVSLGDSPKPPPSRVTLALQTLNHCREVLFMVTGDAKADAIGRIFSVSRVGDEKGSCQVICHPSVEYPASLIRTANSGLPVVWLVDGAAGRDLLSSTAGGTAAT